MNKPLVSICCITYNHEKYIEECIKGFLDQEVNFEIEFLIHDDASTDSTQDIIKKLVGNDSRFKLILRIKNIKSTGKAIFPILFEKARGKYIAMCEGDDYWTDPLKLQKQVGFLENHSNYSAIATNSELKNENTNESHLFKHTKKDNVLYVNDLLKQRHFHTASFLFEKKYLVSFDFPKILSGDRYLFLFIASKKPIYYLNEISCVYRKNEGGISRKVTSKNMIKDLNFIEPTKAFLNNKQHHILKTFIYKTIFQYSHQIKLSHYFFIGLKLLFITKFKRSSFQLIKKSYSKVSLNVN